MKTANDLRQGAKDHRFPQTKWYRVRPAISWTFALGVAVWLGLLVQPETRDVVLAQHLPTLARWVELYQSALLKYGPLLLNVLALLSVIVLLTAALRTLRLLRPLRLKIERSLRFTQRLQPGSSTARA